MIPIIKSSVPVGPTPISGSFAGAQGATTGSLYGIPPIVRMEGRTNPHEIIIDLELATLRIIIYCDYKKIATFKLRPCVDISIECDNKDIIVKSFSVLSEDPKSFFDNLNLKLVGLLCPETPNRIIIDGPSLWELWKKCKSIAYKHMLIATMKQYGRHLTESDVTDAWSEAIISGTMEE
jgi:hypothetical protein